MGWLIALGILAALAVLPLGVSARYNAAGVLVQVIAGPVRVKVFPLKKKEKKQPAENKEEEPPQTGDASPQAEEKKSEPAGEKTPGSWKKFLPLVQVALDFLGDFRRKLRVNRLEMKLILASDDPADLAINYGRAWAALGNLWPRLESLFVIRKRDVQVECDFVSEETRVFARMDMTIALGRLLSLTVRYGIRALKELMKIRKQSKGGAAI